MCSGKTESGDVVVLRENRGHVKVITLQKDASRMVKVSPKSYIPTDSLLNVNYGSTLTLDPTAKKWNVDDPCQDSLTKVTLSSISNLDSSEEVVTKDDEYIKCGKNNKDLVDSNRAQKLTSDDILELKASGLGNDQVIANIVKGSSSFELKSVFSQEKYIQKKEKKHVSKVDVLEPSIFRIAEAYKNKEASKIGGLRFDALSVMLNRASITTGGCVAVFDQSMGLLTGALSCRIKAIGGTIYRLIESSGSQKIAKELSPDCHCLTDHNNSHIKDLSFPVSTRVLPASPPCPLQSRYREGVDNARRSAAIKRLSTSQHFEGKFGGNKRIRSGGEAGAEDCSSGNDDEKHKVTGCDKVVASEEECSQDANKTKELSEVLNSIQGGGVDALLAVVNPNRPNSCADDLIWQLASLAENLIISGGVFIIFSQAFTPLARLQGYLAANEKWTHVRLEEYFLREHQVLPLRTHPAMHSNARLCDGFLLSSIFVLP